MFLRSGLRMLSSVAPAREFDLVVFGASGFAGRLAAEYALRHHGQSLRIALGGRDRSKLEKVRESLGAQVELVVADANSASDMRALADRTECVATTAGPFAKFGSQPGPQ